jgi:ribokinase
MKALKVDMATCRYQAMIGVGGIGSGRFFALNSNHTLGREESRGGRFLDRRDYCKLHIISHYVKTLLGTGFETIPVGRVGDDEEGKRLFEEMKEAGLDTRYVKRSEGDQTLFSFCLVYPDGSGGNLTTADSACSRVDPDSIVEAEPEFARFAGRGVALAAPEVPMAARKALLDLGTQYHFFRVTSLTSEESREVMAADILRNTDLLAVNLDEAASLAKVYKDTFPLSVVEAAIKELCGVKADMLISITAGGVGSWSWDGTTLAHVPAFPVEVVNTAGAGDAHLSGIIAGLAAGLTLSQAQELGGLVATLSVTSPHTIDKRIDRESLLAYVIRAKAPVCDAVMNVLGD